MKFICAPSSTDDVPPEVTDELVIPRVPVESVRTRARSRAVIARPAPDTITPCTAPEEVPARAPEKRVVTR